MSKYLNKMIQRKNDRVPDAFGFVMQYSTNDMTYIVQWIYPVQESSRFMVEGQRYIHQYGLVEFGDPAYD